MRLFAVFIFLWCALFSFALRPLPCHADIYVYVDRNGVRHFTNVPSHSGFHLFARTPGQRPRPHTDRHAYDPYIAEAAHRYGIDPSLIKAVIKIESDFNRHARSSKGAVGLMQLMPETARDLRVRDITDPRENIMAGARYLKRLQTMFNGDLELVLAAYNAGPRIVRHLRRVPDIRETRRYVQTVMQYYRSYKNRI